MSTKRSAYFLKRNRFCFSFMLLFFSLISYSQQKGSIVGTVSNEKSERLEGVSVMVKGSQAGTTTDKNGNFALNAENDKTVLVISLSGFKTQEIPIKQGQPLKITMVSTYSSLDEVVVVGYNTQRRADLTGAVASVNAKDLIDLPPSSLATALQGRIPGAYISQVDGNPNSNAAIIIRGPLSINGGDPLIVVDGVPFQGTGFNFNNQDIESIDVLKDASAAAIYGYRAGGGVILIRTKKGNSGRVKVGVNSSIGVRQVANLPEELDRDNYLRAKEAFGYAVETIYGLKSTWPSLANTNWWDELYRKGTEHNHSLYLSGGTDKSTFYLSGNYASIEGTRIGNSIDRYTFRINSDHKVGKRFKIGQTLYLNYIKEDPNKFTPRGDVSYRNSPLIPVYDSTNPIGGWGKVSASPGFQGSNEVQFALGRYARNEVYEGLLTINFDAEIAKGLMFRTVFATGLTGSNNYFYDYRADIGFGPNAENFGKTITKRQNYIATYTLSYDRSFGKHAIKALAGYEARKSTYSDLQGLNSNPIVPIPQDFNLVQSTATASVSGRNSDVEDRVLSQFGRLEYNFNSKYLLTATIRRDGLASKFGPNNRYGVFPGVSAGWKISNEKFMENVRRISSLKLRGGYGLLGNSVGKDFAYSAAYGTGYSQDYNGGRLNSVNIINRLPNPDIKWESVATVNVGLDVGLFEEKLMINLDYYDRQTKDMIYGVGIAASAGLGADVPANVGQMNNKGFEFNINYRGNISKDFSYSVGFNGAHNKNRLVTINPELGKLFLISGGGINRSEPGRELSNFFGYKVLGIYKDDTSAASGPAIGGYHPVTGDLIYEDLNKDGVINADDRKYIGSPWPELTYGFTMKLGFKNFDLNAFFNGVAGAKLYNAFEQYQHIFVGDYNTSPMIFETSGFAGNGVTSKPRVGTITDYDKNQNWSSVNSYHIQNASYLRLRNVQLGYNLSPAILNKIKISSARVFVAADNVFTITKYKGINPDVGITTPLGSEATGTRIGDFLDRGVDNANFRYPVSRIISIGINAEF